MSELKAGAAQADRGLFRGLACPDTVLTGALADVLTRFVESACC